MRVRCIEACKTLTHWKIYDVIRQDENTIWVINDNGKEDWFSESRFHEIPEKITDFITEFELMVLREALTIVQERFKDLAVESIDNDETDEAKHFIKKLDTAKHLLTLI